MTEKEFSMIINDATARGAVLNMLLIVAVLLFLLVFLLIWLVDLKIKEIKPRSKPIRAV